MDLIKSTIEVETASETELTVLTDYRVSPITPDTEVGVLKKEYSIVGDGLYASINSEDAPQWLLSIIDSVVENSIANGMLDYDLLVQDVRNAIDALDVAKNTYVEQINFTALVDGIIGTHLTTLNATWADTYATIAQLDTVVANADYALTQAVTDLTASYSSEINARITDIQTAYADADGALTSDITALTAAFVDQENNINGVANAVTTLETYVGVDPDGTPNSTGMLSRINILEKQNDGIIEYTTDTYDVMIGIEDPNTNTLNDQLDVTKEPYASWIALDTASGTDEIRASHIGDVYMQYATNTDGTTTYIKSYKFIKTAIDTTSPYTTDSEGYTWALTVDTDTQAAYVTALGAWDLADSKRRVFTVEPYVPYDTGDLWVTDSDGSSSANIKRCVTSRSAEGVYSAADWVLVATDDYTVTMLNNGLADGTVAVNLSSATIDGTTSLTTYVGNEVDKQVVVYSGTNHTTQLGMKENDLYIEKTVAVGSSGVSIDVVNTFKYNGITWVPIGTNDNLTALADLADNKRTIFAGSTIPELQGYTPEVRDIWIPDANNSTYLKGEVYQYDGTSWILATTYTENLNDFINNAYTPDSAQLHRQLDGKIEYFFYDSYADVVGASSEATALVIISSAWATQEVRDEQNGNVVYFKDTTNGYWYQASLHTWLTITDTSIYQALQNAATAQGAADGVVVSYYAWAQTTAPATTILWFTDSNLLKRYVGGTWVTVSAKDGDTLTAYNNTTKDITGYEYISGTWAIRTPDGIVAHSKAITDLDFNVTALDTSIFGESGLEQTLTGDIGAEGARVESKFKYGSTIGIDGVYYSSAFGLTSTVEGGSGTVGSPYSSEFWVNAQKFKFTNTAKSVAISPFTIDATGPTPQITFNGNVSFTNLSNPPTHTSGSGIPTGTAIAGSTYTQTSTNPDTLWVYTIAGWIRGGDPNALTAYDLGANGTTTIDGGRIEAGTLILDYGLYITGGPPKNATSGSTLTGNSSFENGKQYWASSYSGEAIPQLIDGDIITGVGDWGGNVWEKTGAAWVYSQMAIPVDTSKTYTARFKVRQTINPTVGGSSVYAGVVTLDKNFVNLTGGAGTHRYFCISDQTITQEQGWLTFEGRISGVGDAANNFRPNTAYVRPMFIVNYSGGNGTAQVDGLEFFEDVAASHGIADNADVTANSDFVTTIYPADKEGLQNQIDGKVESWFQSGDPSTAWTTADIKLQHTGDMWWNSTTKVLKRYSGTGWSAAIEDIKAINAFDKASIAQSTADRKMVVFTTTPANYDVGDLWDAGGSPRVLKRAIRAGSTYAAGDWVTVANEVTNTNQVTDGANLGKTSNWSGVSDDNGNKPADNADVTDYTDYRVSNSDLSDSVLRIANPQGASFSGGSGATGAIVIVLPQSWTNTMMKFEVDVFLYQASRSFTLHCGGYNYAGTAAWHTTFAQLLGNRESNNRVRFGHNGSKCVVVIGDTTSVWQYPKVSVKNFQGGHQNITTAKWATGWDVLLATSLTDYTFTSSFADSLLDAKSILGQGVLAKQDTVTWDTQVTDIPYEQIYSNDDSVALGFNPTFSEWTGTYPANWAGWSGAAPTKATASTDVRVGQYAVKYPSVTGGNLGIQLQKAFTDSPLPAGTFISGSLDVKLLSRTSGLPGILVRLYTNSAKTTFVDTKVQPGTSVGDWQRIPWTARVGVSQQIYAIHIYVMASWTAFSSGSFTGGVIFDNLRFAMFDSSVDNKSITINTDGSLFGGGGGAVTITGLGYSGDLDATEGAQAGTNIYDESGGIVNNSDFLNSAVFDIIAKDTILDKAEKIAVRVKLAEILAEKNGLVSAGNAIGVASALTTAYTTAYNTLSAYLTGTSTSQCSLNVDSDTTIVANTFKTNFSNYATALETYRKAITDKASTKSSWSFVDDDNGKKPTDNADNTAETIIAGLGLTAGELKMTDALGDYVQLTPGNLDFHYGGYQYKSVKRVEVGSASNGERQYFFPAFKTTPKVMVSTKDLASYVSDQNAYTQRMVMEAANITTTGFTPNVMLRREGTAYYTDPGGGISEGGVFSSYTTTRSDVTQVGCTFTAYSSYTDERQTTSFSYRNVRVYYVNSSGTWVNIYNATPSSPNAITVWSPVVPAGIYQIKITIDGYLTLQDKVASVSSVNFYTTGQAALASGDVNWIAIEQ